MKSAARKTPDHKPARKSGDAVTEEPVIEEQPESPGEQTITFRPIQDGDPAPEPAGSGDDPASADGDDGGTSQSRPAPNGSAADAGAEAGDEDVPEAGADAAAGPEVAAAGPEDAGGSGGDRGGGDAGNGADIPAAETGTAPAAESETAASSGDDAAGDAAAPAGDGDEVPGRDGDDEVGTGRDAAESETAGGESAEIETAENETAGDDGGAPAGQTGGSTGRIREMPLPDPVSEALTKALDQLRVAVKGLHFGLDVPGSDEARKAQAAVLAQIDDYVIPRVHMSTAPALIVVAGSTGAGKSTLVNTLAAQKVTATGVRRPTTSVPVLACHPDDRDWFAKGDLLGGLNRLDEPADGAGTDSVVVVPTPRLPQGVALLDTPDIDSVVEAHHDSAHRMLDAADLWVFVTTAARYADAPSWGLLRRAKERGARLVIVLSRVPSRSRDVIVKHFGRMLDEYGMGEVERFVVNETSVRDGRLPEIEITELRMWLAELSVDDERRTAAVQATLNGVLNSFRSRLPALARHLETQVALRADLRSDVDAAYTGALAEIDEATRNGSLLRGEVLARWQDFAGSGDLMRTLQLRRGSKGSHQGPERVRALKASLRTGLESVITSAAQRAAEEVVARWRQRAGAGDRLAATPGLGRPSEEVMRRTSRTITSWQDHVTELIRTEGVTKRSVAKIISFDVESLSLIFTVGLLGYGTADVSVGSGTSALPQRLLRGLLGAESLRSISAKARSDLRARIGLLFDEETLRYVDALDSAGIPDEAAATRLYQATYNLEVAR
ncbi:dynamin family protein [Microbispora sp. ATCC PTA-5024]|uniref:dynamin family protein n=1 Tax=Microbispora sp. ATCC PTA-5024 TaxID=316330 RepID=UPI00041C01C3|nr:GTPase domain-containing protein [Microbispora sp. ATCC PTA-5024]